MKNTNINDNSQDERIRNYLIDNREFHKEILAKFVEAKGLAYKANPNVLHDDIKSEFNGIIRFNICNEVCMNLALDFESVYVIVEELNLEEYLK